MHAVILAAGKGTRLAPLTDSTPKPLLEVAGARIIERTLRELPDEITNVIIVTKYLEEQFHDFAQKYSSEHHSVSCVTQGAMHSTFGAVLAAKDHVTDHFLVLNGDDIYSRRDLEALLSHNRAIGASADAMPGYELIEQNSDNTLVSLSKNNIGGMQPTGTYLLDTGFFELTPTEYAPGEFGIPQTLGDNASNYAVSVVRFEDWMPINTIEHLQAAEEKLQS